MTEKEKKTLLLRRSYQAEWEDYERSLYQCDAVQWDHVILTASNDTQAEVYREQIRYRQEHGLLPSATVYTVLPDPEGKRVGSGGATFNALRFLAERRADKQAKFNGMRVLVIHSGGDSKRVPQYSAVGKLFSPVPRELPNGSASTLFDEFMIAMAGVAARIREGMLVLSGDVLLMFDPTQIDFQNRDAAAISVKVPVSVGKNHGVFLAEDAGNVDAFLHKQPEALLLQKGAVDSRGNVNLDTGGVFFGPRVLEALFSVISTDGRLDAEKFKLFVNEEARISFYGDFLYPLGKSATLAQYRKEAAEGTLNEALLACREKLWETLSRFEMQLICLEPAEFIHFGTTKELCKLMTEDLDCYAPLGWSRKVITNARGRVSACNADVGAKAVIGPGAYLEHCSVLDGSVIGTGSVISNVTLQGEYVGDNVVLHGLPLADGTHVVRIYGVTDDPKACYDRGITLLGCDLHRILERNGLTAGDVWEDDAQYLWFARLYPACDREEDALAMALVLQKMAQGTATAAEVGAWKLARRESLHSSFSMADVQRIYSRQRELEQRIRSKLFVDKLNEKEAWENAIGVFGHQGVTEGCYCLLLQMAEEGPLEQKMRIYHALARYMEKQGRSFLGQNHQALEAMCFDALRSDIIAQAARQIPQYADYRIRQDRVTVELPLRVNWGGGWTDTPPYCMEKGGMVINGAIKVRGEYPVWAEVRRIDDYRVEFRRIDTDQEATATTVAEIRDCSDPNAPFSLHKAALIASGLIPLEAEEQLQQIFRHLGGGIRISTHVRGIPHGSGLGASSILAGACIKAIFEWLGLDYTINTVSHTVLAMEQLMTTGGGWQDQIGGLVSGIKLIESQPGPDQTVHIRQLSMPMAALEELQQRFALIYTGQRRLARDLLRKVVGNYIGNREETLTALEQMKPLTQKMKTELERGNIDMFAALLNQQWALTQQLDPGAANGQVEQIFRACWDLTDGRFICGAGGGGFLQVILKKGITREQLRQRLAEVFPERSVDVWETEFV